MGTERETVEAPEPDETGRNAFTVPAEYVVTGVSVGPDAFGLIEDTAELPVRVTNTTSRSPNIKFLENVGRPPCPPTLTGLQLHRKHQSKRVVPQGIRLKATGNLTI